MTLEKETGTPLRTWALWFFCLTILSALLSAYPLFISSSLHRMSAVIGWGVSFLVCVVSGYLAFWSLGRSHNTFLLVALGGIVLRLALISGAVYVGISLLQLHTVIFLGSLLGSYTMYHGLEIIVLNQSKALVRTPGGSGAVAQGDEAH